MVVPMVVLFTCDNIIVAISDVAGMGTELPLLPFITHEMLATEDAGLLHLGVTFEQIPMRIPPGHTASVRAEAALPMSWT